MANITQDLKNLLSKNKNITTVYFDANGNHHLNCYKSGDKVVAGGGSVEITETLTRAQVLGKTAVASPPTEKDILGSIEKCSSEKELKAIKLPKKPSAALTKAYAEKEIALGLGDDPEQKVFELIKNADTLEKWMAISLPKNSSSELKTAYTDKGAELDGK